MIPYAVHSLLLATFLPAALALTTEYCSSPPKINHGFPTIRGRGILGYPVGSFAYYQCDGSYRSKDGVELYRSCEFNGERAVWSDASSECVPAPPGQRPVKRIGNAVVSVVGRDDSGPSTPPTPAEKAKNESKSSLTTAEDQPETPVVYSSPDEDDEAADEDEEEDGEEEEDNDDSDTTIEHQADSFRYHGNRYGSAFGKPPPEKPDAPQAGFAIYPAVPLSEHYVTAYAKIPDSQATHLVHDYGPTWNVPVGVHYAPPALTERNRKIKIQLRSNSYGRTPEEYTYARMAGPGSMSAARNLGLPAVSSDLAWTPSFIKPGPDPVLSRYAYGCGPAPYVAHANPSRPLQLRYSIGSKISYSCGSGKYPNVPKDLMTTECVLDNGKAEWTPISGACMDDFDYEFPEDQAAVRRKLQGWTMAKEQKPGFVTVEKEIEVHPQPPPSPYQSSARISYAEPAPGMVEAKPDTVVPWPLNYFLKDGRAAAGDRASRDQQQERDRIVVSKTLFLQPPAFPSPPGRTGPKKAEKRTPFALCASLEPAPYDPETCRKPPSMRELAIMSIFSGKGVPKGLNDFEINLGSSADENDVHLNYGMPGHNRYGGVRNPEEIVPPPVSPNGPGQPIRVDLANERDSAAGSGTVVGVSGSGGVENDARNCAGDECIPGPGPDELEGGRSTQAFSYEVPPKMIANGKLYLNIFHGNDRRSFTGEGVQRSLGDTGFPFNEMYRQQPAPHRDHPPSSDSSKNHLPIEKRAYALSERLMRGGLHMPRGNETEEESNPQMTTVVVLGISGAIGLAIIVCKCYSACSNWFCNVCPEECDEEGGATAGISSDLLGEDAGDGYGKKTNARISWRKRSAQQKRGIDRMEHSDG